MSIKSELLLVLESRKGEFLSGEQLAERLGCSRTAVWKAMKRLREEGYRIDAVNNRGYALEAGNDLLSAEAILPKLTRKDIFLEVEKEVTSTNQLLKKKAMEIPVPHGSVIIAEAQTQGRGRRGRCFYSPKGSGLYLSVLLRTEKTAQQSMCLTAAAAVAVFHAVQQVCGVTLGIKWVNDLYLGEKKVCGILTEAVSDFETGDIEFVIVGIGLNLKEPKDGFPEAIKDRAGTIVPGGVYVDRNLLAAQIINNLLEEAAQNRIPREYRTQNLVPGRTVRVVYGEKERTVRAKEILPDGTLLVENEAGKDEILLCGDVSLHLS